MPSIKRAAGRPTQPSALAEHSMVALARSLDLPDGRSVPAGAVGAVVFVHAGAEAYEVEFIDPFHAVATVEAPHLSRVRAA